MGRSKKEIANLLPKPFRRQWECAEVVLQSRVVLVALPIVSIALLAIYFMKRGIPFFDAVSALGTTFMTLIVLAFGLISMLYVIYVIPITGAKALIDNKVGNLSAAAIMTLPLLTAISGLFWWGYEPVFKDGWGSFSLASVFGFETACFALVVWRSRSEVGCALTKSRGDIFYAFVMSLLPLLVALALLVISIDISSRYLEVEWGALHEAAFLVVLMAAIFLFYAGPTWLACIKPLENLKERLTRFAGVLVLLVFVFPGGGRFVDLSLFILNSGGGMKQVLVLDKKAADAPRLRELLDGASSTCGKGNDTCDLLTTSEQRIRFVSATTTYVSISEAPPKDFWSWMERTFFDWSSKESLAIANSLIVARYPVDTNANSSQGQVSDTPP